MKTKYDQDDESSEETQEDARVQQQQGETLRRIQANEKEEK